MSSSESGDESRDSTESQPKYNRPRTRISRACDTCRRRKGDVGSVPGRKCTNCVVYNRACTFNMTVKVGIILSSHSHRLRMNGDSYVEHLENVLHSMESLLKNLYPDIDFSEELGTIEPRTRTSKRQAKTAATASSSSANVPKVKSTDSFPREEEALLSDDDDTVCIQTLEERLERIKIHPIYSRYIGKASAPFLIQKVYEAKQEYRAESGLDVDRSKERPRSGTRPEFLQLHPWIAPLMHNPSPHQDFPPTDLREKLVELYFRNFNDYYPLFHRPTFEQRISDGLHLSDEGFGSTVLLVCALGSKFSDDPRVLVDGEDRCPQTRGWRYFRQVQSVQKSLLAPPQLHDLQICALSALFLRCSNIPRWTVIGAGIRMAQDVGAHRQKSYGKVHTVEIEHWRRAFWVLVAIDREMSMGLGRPYATQDEDYDLDMPAECDDEYWVISDNEVKFKQPSGRPSKITYFNRLVQLNQILATALRTIYSINKAKVLSGLAGRPWEEDIISKLDSALNEWLDTLPEHLRWDPDRADRRKEIFLNQSAQLYTLFYQAQIIVHRTFIPALRKTSSPSFPSLVICANAARSTARILSVPFRRYNSVSMFSINAMVCAAVALLLNIWGSRRSGAPSSSHEDMVYVELLLDMLKHLETQWFNAGRIWYRTLYDPSVITG
ncbi:hypothetical protein K474DRAFT_1588720 [Panus rudis PR-1116 ss-1]|nr:hypothetical protein K474DRAFT_1588720 [Panus rudis PR-1116 ss-1]